MERLEFIKENWVIDNDISLKWATTMVLPDFKGEEKECWHLRGRSWKWLTLKCNFSGLKEHEYELTFWGKFDYYSGLGTQCFIILYEDWEKRITYNVNPNCPNAVAKAGEWVLYKFPVKLEYGSNLSAELISFEANIAIMQANQEDEKDLSVVKIQSADQGVPYYINQELPFKEYTYLEQRMVKYYSDLLASYYPCKDIPEAGQSEYYEFVKGLYKRLFTKPEEFFKNLYEDDAYPNRFNCREYGKPELKVHMKKDRDKIEELFQLLLTVGSEGEVTEEGLLIKSDLNKKQLTMLSYMNFEVKSGILKHQQYPGIGPVIKYLAGKEKPLLSLMYCWFDSTYPYLVLTHEKFYDWEQYKRLTDWLYENGYCTNINAGNEITLDFYKSINKKENKVGNAMFGDKFHYGFTFEHRSEPRGMQHCEPRIIQFANMLKYFEELSENTKWLIQARTKQCDNCRYCVQTDKTGKRPLAAIKLADGTSRCPYYPGFNYIYETLSKQDVDIIIDFLSDMEKMLDRK